MMEVELKSVREMQVACICYEGFPEKMGNLIEVLLQWAADKSLNITGPPFGIYCKSRTSNKAESVSEQLKYQIGIPFQGDAQEEKGIKIMNIPERIVLSSTVKCSHGELKQYHDLFFAYALDHGFEVIDSPLEIYLNKFTEIPEVDLLTEIQLPVYQKLRIMSSCLK